jgi:hypothetical protein
MGGLELITGREGPCRDAMTEAGKGAFLPDKEPEALRRERYLPIINQALSPERPASHLPPTKSDFLSDKGANSPDSGSSTQPSPNQGPNTNPSSPPGPTPPPPPPAPPDPTPVVSESPNWGQIGAGAIQTIAGGFEAVFGIGLVGATEGLGAAAGLPIAIDGATAVGLGLANIAWGIAGQKPGTPTGSIPSGMLGLLGAASRNPTLQIAGSSVDDAIGMVGANPQAVRRNVYAWGAQKALNP